MVKLVIVVLLWKPIGYVIKENKLNGDQKLKKTRLIMAARPLKQINFPNFATTANLKKKEIKLKNNNFWKLVGSFYQKNY